MRCATRGRTGTAAACYRYQRQGAPSAQFSRDKILMAGGAMAFGDEDPKQDTLAR